MHRLQRCGWQAELASAITEPAELLTALGLPAQLLEDLEPASRDFRLRVPRSFVQRMQPGDPDDPLLRQVLPRAEENLPVSGYVADPVGDLDAMTVPGLLHKYHGRALLVTTGACGVHCRYCFRRHFPYSEANPAQTDWQPALDYLAADTSLREIILSGGDPLMLSDNRLAGLVERLEAIPHLQRLRLHTRLPVVLPARVDSALTDWLSRTRLQSIIVLHINHPNELDPSLSAACERLRASGSALLNQSVLLKGINDRAETLVALSERLFAAGIQPYYLHQLDPVAGAAHFAINDEQAGDLLAAMREQLSGYLVPKLVREQAGKPAKTPV
ncbi:MAG: EF-P beta-lysylation protein EpmB [Granulosicoccaceae bacterium]|jgi:EF-P beta-lysylation protein EpmB